MKTSVNICNGTTYSLEYGDQLESLPVEYSTALTPEIVSAFNSPIDFFRDIAHATRCESFAKFLLHCTESNNWSLDVSETYLPMRDFSAEFRFATYTGPPFFLRPGKSKTLNSEFREIDRYATRINWGGIGCAGMLFSYDDQCTLEQYGFESKNPVFPPKTTTVFGNSPCGDAMIYNADGQAGYITHETFDSYEFGRLSSMIDWVFDSLTNGHWPDLQYDRLPDGG